jgi:phage shock protein PspC (stress-responsive transcriptional regulator)
MSDTTHAPPPVGRPDPAGATRPPLTRSRTDRKVAGVCGGLGAYFGIDPLIIRIVIVILSIFGGSGILLYAAGWLLIPDEGESQSTIQRLVDRGGDAGPTLVAIVVACVLLILLASVVGLGQGIGRRWWFGGPDLWPIIIVAAIAGAVWYSRRPDRPTPSAPPPGQPAAEAPTATATTSVAPPSPSAPPPVLPAPDPYAPPTPPPYSGGPVSTVAAPPRERSVLGTVTLSLLLVAAGVMVLLDRATAWHVPFVTFVAVLLGIVGLGLVVGAFVGRSRGLIGMGVLLTLVTALAAAVPAVDSARTGDVVWAPASSAAVPAGGYRWAAGQATLDLGGLTGGTAARVQLGAGNLLVVVPADAQVVVRARVGIGTIVLPDGVTTDGFSPSVDHVFGPSAGQPAQVVTLRLDLGVGQLEVRRAQA